MLDFCELLDKNMRHEEVLFEKFLLDNLLALVKWLCWKFNLLFGFVSAFLIYLAGYIQLSFCSRNSSAHILWWWLQGSIQVKESLLLSLIFPWRYVCILCSHWNLSCMYCVPNLIFKVPNLSYVCPIIPSTMAWYLLTNKFENWRFNIKTDGSDNFSWGVA